MTTFKNIKIQFYAVNNRSLFPSTKLDLLNKQKRSYLIREKQNNFEYKKRLSRLKTIFYCTRVLRRLFNDIDLILPLSPCATCKTGELIYNNIFYNVHMYIVW